MTTSPSRSRRAFLRDVAVAVGALATLDAPRVARAQAKLPDTIKMGYLPVNAVLPMYVSEAVNFWKDEGLKVEFLRFAGGPAILEALASGSIPCGDVGNSPAIVTASRGLPFIFPTLGGVSAKQFPYTRIMVHRD